MYNIPRHYIQYSSHQVIIYKKKCKGGGIYNIPLTFCSLYCGRLSCDRTRKKKPQRPKSIFSLWPFDWIQFHGGTSAFFSFFLSNLKKKKKFNFDCSKHAQRYIYIAGCNRKFLTTPLCVCQVLDYSICTGNLK